MSTEFYCEEFPAEQNGKPVQTLKDLLEACPEDRFHFMTPFGYVDLTAQDAGQQELVSVRKAENGQWYAITTDPQPKMSESEQMQEMQL